MFTAINRIRVTIRGGEELAKRFGRDSRIELAPGFLGVRFLGRIWSQSEGETVEFLCISEWDSERSFTAWTRGAAFRHAQDDLGIEFVLEGDPAPVGVGR
jgi:heme-degrading monooxygenase HmoA